MREKIQKWGLAAVAGVTALGSSIHAFAVDAPIVPTSMGIEWAGTVTNIGVEYGKVVGAVLGLMLGAIIVRIAVGWIKRAA